MERYCSSCGKKIAEGVLVCPQCGTSQIRVQTPHFLSKTVIGIVDVIAGGLTTLAGFTYFSGSAVDLGFLATGIGLIMTGVFFLTGK